MFIVRSAVFRSTVLWCGIGFLVAAAGGCGSSTETAKPNVIIFLVDTLRPDHLGAYGYPKDTSPELDAFARDAVVFKQASSPSSWTKPATASLLTGLLPHKHGAVTLTNRIPEDVNLFSEYLHPLSYTTAAFVANANVIDVWGFDQGFTWFDDVKGRTGDNDAEVVVDAALDYISKNKDQPLFIYLHTVDPHGPYDPPQPFKGRWTKGVRGKVEMPRDLSSDTPQANLKRTIAAYDGEIAYNDFQFGRLLEGLKAEGLYENSFIFFVADHGEEQVEHGRGGHSHTLYEELVRVPMVLKFPGEAHAGDVVDVPVSILDAIPTVLGHLGEAIPDVLDGLDLNTAISDPSTPSIRDRMFFFDLDAQRWDGSINILGGVRYRDYKLIERTHPVKEEALYNLADDPLEQRNIIRTERDRADKLLLLLAKNRLDSRSGLQLRLINGLDNEVRVFHGTFTTTGRFTDLERRQTEEEDIITLEEDDRRLSFRITCRNYKNPTRKHPPIIIDEDCFTFRLDPPDAPITVEKFACEGLDGLPLYLGQERTKVDKLPRTFSMDSLELLALNESTIRRTSLQTVSDLPPGGTLIAFPDRIRQDVEMDEATRDRLKALGYIK